MNIRSEVFSNQTLQDWQTLAEKELKGKSLDSLVRQKEEGIFLFPYATQAKTTDEPTFRATTSWQLHQSFQTNDPLQWNGLALEALNGGANSLTVPASFNASDMKVALKDVFVGFIHWELEAHAEQADDQIDAIKQAYEAQDRAGVLSFFHSKHINTNASFANHATASEQIAFAVLAGIEFIENTHLSIDEASAQILFHFSVGSELYVEIAKLRAFRAVWSHVMKSGTFEHACSNHAFVKVQTDGYFQAKIDTDNNLIRATIQALAACVGGANRIEVLPMEYGNGIDANDPLRWARNIQHLLIEESYFDQYSDLAKGSYALEKLTEDLSTKALQTMKEFETSGKLEHFIQSKKEERSLQHAQRVVVGENKYVRS
ncbi:MAG: hypothetical protein RLZZ71_1501 [Bacteroidota bacterium]|jgi:hypothetical protein